MSAELTVGAFVAKFWSPIAAFAVFVISHIKLNGKVEAQADRVDRMESGLTTALNDLKGEVKDMNRKVDQASEKTTDLHIKILESLNK